MTGTTQRKSREHLGISQRELACRVGVTCATVTRWENGTRNPSGMAQLAITNFKEGTDSRSRQRVAEAVLNDLWDNPEDAVCEAWQEHYSCRPR